MKSTEYGRLITLSEHASAGKREKAAETSRLKAKGGRAESGDYFHTVFGLLGEKRHSVIAFIEMKLDCRRRRFFTEAIDKCKTTREECRCVKTYIRHLSVKDLNVLLKWVRQVLGGTMEAIAYPGEPDPERRLTKFARSFGLSEAEVDRFMLYFLLAS